jgi:SAM-dependent methyltransferase
MDPDPSQVNRQTYDQIAGQFAARTAHMDAWLIGRTSRLVEQLRPGARILDVGCGPGRDLRWFIENGVHAFGVDLSNGMLLEARRVQRSALGQMEMRRLAFASGSFAGVWCNAALLHLPKTEVPKALAEISRVLAPGGIFILSLQKGNGEGFETGQNENTVRYFARYTPQEMEQFLAQAGFLVLRQDEYEYGRTWIWFETVQSQQVSSC